MTKNLIFVRGTGIDSTKKIHKVNGINMYQQYVWIKGKYIVDELKRKNALIIFYLFDHKDYRNVVFVIFFALKCKLLVLLKAS